MMLSHKNSISSEKYQVSSFNSLLQFSISSTQSSSIQTGKLITKSSGQYLYSFK